MATAATIQPTEAHHHNAPQYPLSNASSNTNANNSTQPTAVPIPRGEVTASLYFYSPPSDGSAPFNYVETPPPGEPQRNYGEAIHDIQVHDLRGREDLASTDTHSFAALRDVPSAVPLSIFHQDDTPEADQQIKEQYYPEVKRLLKDQLSGQVHKVVIFDHTIRRAGKAGSAKREPVTRAHVDQTATAALVRVKMHIEDQAEAEELLKGRCRIVNVWRPLGAHPVASFPLAVADGSTVAPNDLVGVEHRYPDRTGETAGVRYNPDQKWWYWSGMTPDERLLLKCSDTDPEVGEVGRAPHSAFVDPRSAENAPGRESIEVRCLVFG